MVSTPNKPNVLLVHGAWHGAWCWDKLVPELVAEGWEVSTVDLPSATADTTTNAGMYDDARAIRDRLERIDGPVVIVAHSYGGLPATEAAAGASNVTRIIYLSAFLLDAGASLASTVRQAGGEQLPSGESGTMQPPDDGGPIERFYGDVAREDVERTLARLVPQTVKSFNEELTGAAWRTIPSTFLVCEEDRAIPAAMQEAMAAQATTVRRIRSSHSPFLSMPAELAQQITAAAMTGADREEPAWLR
jgi:pimeloyl-ACP methyl ester carboxylesterase